jgi:hypothetical protein
MGRIVKVGDLVRITDRYHGHKFIVGNIVEITQVNNIYYRAECKGGQYGYLHTEEFELIEDLTKTGLIQLAKEKGFVNGAKIKSIVGREHVTNGQFMFENGYLYSNNGRFQIYDAQTKQWATVLESAQVEPAEIEVLKSEIQHLKDLQKSMDTQHLELQATFIDLKLQYEVLEENRDKFFLKSIKFKHKYLTAKDKIKKLKKKLNNTKD